MAKAKLDPKVDKPQNLSEVSKGFMLDYMREVGNEKDREWFKEVCNKNVVEKENHLKDGEKYKDIDLKVVRRAFCEKYYPTLMKAKKKGASYLDLVNNL